MLDNPEMCPPTPETTPAKYDQKRMRLVGEALRTAYCLIDYDGVPEDMAEMLQSLRQVG